jgi:hypothetical protein
MGRNYHKNKNITIPLGRDSETLVDLIEDARRSGMSHQIGLFAGIRLSEYYRAIKQGRILPEGTAVYPTAAWGTPAAAAPNMPPAGHQNGNSNTLSPAQRNEPSASELAKLANRPEFIAASSEEVNDGDLAFFIENDEEDEDG